MKSMIKKEILEGIRTYKFLIIIIVFMFFALLNPVMNKLILPEILKSQFTGMSEDMLNSMLVTSQVDNVIGYIGDIFEIGTIVVVLSLASLVAGELKNRSFIFPVCSGKSFTGMVASKIIVYGVFTIIVALLAVLTDYLYAGVLFGFDIQGIMPVIRAGLLLGLFFAFLISLVIASGAFVKKPITAGLIALIPAYGISIVSGLFKINKYTPAGLLTEANRLAEKADPGLILTVLITITLIVAFSALAVLKLNSIELAKRT